MKKKEKTTNLSNFKAKLLCLFNREIKSTKMKFCVFCYKKTEHDEKGCMICQEKGWIKYYKIRNPDSEINDVNSGPIPVTLIFVL
jgi:hypothetical protein